MENRIKVTKDKIKRYLQNYTELSHLIKKRELKWILEKGPTLDEWREGKNTVENQAINLIEDNKLNELRFFKNNIDKYLLILKNTRDKKLYKYIIFKYIKENSDEEMQKIFNSNDLQILDEKAINYFYINLNKELNKKRGNK